MVELRKSGANLDSITMITIIEAKDGSVCKPKRTAYCDHCENNEVGVTMTDEGDVVRLSPPSTSFNYANLNHEPLTSPL
jgi:hypothetical protein